MSQAYRVQMDCSRVFFCYLYRKSWIKVIFQPKKRYTFFECVIFSQKPHIAPRYRNNFLEVYSLSTWIWYITLFGEMCGFLNIFFFFGTFYHQKSCRISNLRKINYIQIMASTPLLSPTRMHTHTHTLYIYIYI